MKAKKYSGTIYWNPGTDDEASGDVTICFLRPNEIVIELFYEHRKYDAKLDKRGEIFVGQWQTYKPKPDAGVVSCSTIPKGDDVQLSGNWNEDGIDRHFRADLDPDEY